MIARTNEAPGLTHLAAQDVYDSPHTHSAVRLVIEPAENSSPDDPRNRQETRVSTVKHDFHDIENREDITRLVTHFYGQLFEDEVLGPIFRDVAKVNLAEHIPVFTDFWENILFRTGAYRGGFMAVHGRLHMMTPLRLPHVQRWLTYWVANVDAMFTGPNADLVKDHAQRVGTMMVQRLEMFDQQVRLMATDNRQ
jgi:hemoglobin